MDLLNMILSSGNGGAVEQLGKNFGLDSGQATSAISNLLPALGRGLAANTSKPGGLESLMKALSSGGHARYFDDLETLGDEETVRDGNGILGHILGSKEVSRQVAGAASQKTGIGPDILKKILPVVAAMTMGALSKQGAASNLRAAGTAPGAQDGLMKMLGRFIDRDRDGSVMDDLWGMASKFLKK